MDLKIQPVGKNEQDKFVVCFLWHVFFVVLVFFFLLFSQMSFPFVLSDLRHEKARHEEEIFYREGRETLAQVVHPWRHLRPGWTGL